MSKKKTLADIFNDDEFGILDSKPKNSNVKTEDERLIESFQDINAFFEKNNREPEATNVTEFKLLSRLKALRKDAKKVEVLKPYDSHNLLNTKEEVKSVEDILNDDDLGILDTDETLSIFKLKNVKSASERAETDFTAQRKAMKDKEFLSYESKFKAIHKELREGNRKLFTYENAKKNLRAGSYYILNGVLLFLESVDIETKNVSLPSGNRLREDGRTRIIFENGTISNMKYRSLDKALLHKDNDGKIVSHTEEEINKELFNSVNSLNEEDVKTGWIYVLRSKSTNPDIASINDLYKIGFSSIDVNERIKNASKESTYLYADVHLLDKYACYNIDSQKFEHLLHRFFADVCLNVDVFDDKGKRITPREWFVAPRLIIDKVVTLILSGDIVKYKYDAINHSLLEK
ncbi:GIY-YIG nuclease family protein [Winogradskyella thalassocola]|uniref:T5orf172 domain-containing protein n=1 Tax=Winogradskyella thalassocola TaxID=262004 RepID=A0A1G7ZMG4_9FLAO|nr:GIY-YIG nuclease family protein [Winogradskyella thalassocola]SDH09839.1 T5orf172 domain-containing protein [Winogradskyella thalassocola]